jgi:ribosomal protein L18
MAKATRTILRQRRHARVRAKVHGSTERPRLNVYRSLEHIYAQVIDDTTGTTLASSVYGGSRAAQPGCLAHQGGAGTGCRQSSGRTSPGCRGHPGSL